MKNRINVFKYFRVLLFLVLIILVGTSKLFAQPPSLPANANFYDYMSSFYNSSRYNPLDESEGGEKAQHERLGMIWGPRLYPHGNFSIANKSIIDYAQNFTPVNVRAEQPNWTCIGPSDNPTNTSSHGVGQIHRITFDPNYNGITNKTIYACSGYGGLWRTENDGAQWNMVNTDILPMTSVSDVAVNPNNTDIIFISTGVPDGGVTLEYSPNWTSINPIYTIGIYRSTDYGLTWQAINSGFLSEFYNNGGTVRKLTIDPTNPNVLFAATSQGVFRTENALAPSPVWLKVFTGLTNTDGDFRSVEFKPGSSSVIYASSSNIFKSLDGGDT